MLQGAVGGRKGGLTCQCSGSLVGVVLGMRPGKAFTERSGAHTFVLLDSD